MKAKDTWFAMIAFAAACGSGASGAPDEQNDAAPDDGDSVDDEDVTIPPTYPADGFCSEPGPTWAWCEDFDGQGMDAPAAFAAEASSIAYHDHSHMTMIGTMCETSGDCAPYVRGGSLFLNAEDGGFGMNVLRVEQPFNFTGREGRIHYRSNMKGHPRMHQTVHIAQLASNSMPDLRFTTVLEALDEGPAISIDFWGDGGAPFLITLWKDGEKGSQYEVNGPLGIEVGTGADQFDLDFYLSRNHLRVELNGTEVFDKPIDDLGFDVGYVSFGQLAYNPVKDGYPGDDANTFLWDNFAFDGPSLARNSLTPADKQDVLFRAWNKGSCTVRGVPADGPINPTNNFLFDTWHVRFDVDEPAVTPSDIQCVANSDYPPPDNQADIGDIQVVKR